MEASEATVDVLAERSRAEQDGREWFEVRAALECKMEDGVEG